jgi:hypothetical protein
MTKKLSDGEIHRLLSRGGLGGPAREQVLAQVLDRVAPGGAPAKRRRSWIGALALATGSGLALLGLLVARPHSTPEGGEFRAKGSDGGNAVAFDVSCAASPRAGCHAGSTLLFSVFRASAPGYLNAYAEPVGGGARIWYFSAESESPRVAASANATSAARRGIVIGREHAPGRYLVRVFLSTAPLPESALLAGRDPRVLASAAIALTIEPR